MSFSKAQRFNPDKVCGPPPTAYDPKHPGGSGVISFPKGERFKHDSGQNGGHPHDSTTITRSHSSSSVGSSDSCATSKSNKGKKDHAHCNKQIAELERELRNITKERNQLLIRKRPNGDNKEGDQTSADSLDAARITSHAIEELQSKLDKIKELEQEKLRLENERDSTVAELKSKDIEMSNVLCQIEELKTVLKEEETRRNELEITFKRALEDKKEMELEISELGQKLENLENVRVELVKEIETVKECQQKALEDLRTQHALEFENVKAAHSEQVQQLENNIQQHIVEHDAESEQLKFEFNRQIEELNQIHSSNLSKLENEQRDTIASIQSAHEEKVSQLQASRDALETQYSTLSQRHGEVTVALETKLDEVETLKTQLDVANEKLETNRVQAEEKYLAMKRTLELDIAECQARHEEQRRSEEEKLRTTYEAELARLEQTHRELTELHRAQEIQLKEAEEAHALSCKQYEEQLERLNKNNETEKEIMLWQMNQQRENLELELKTAFESQLHSKEAEFECQRAEWETKLNQAIDDNASRIATLQVDHESRLSQDRERYETAIEKLEREKSEILEERDQVVKTLQEKEAEIEKLSIEMKEAVAKLELDLEMLRESNNQLVADILRIEKDHQVTEERIESEKVLLKSQAEEEKAVLIKSFEDVIASVKAESSEKEELIIKLTGQFTESEAQWAHQLAEKETLMQDAKIAHETCIAQVSFAHSEEIKNLHRDYERVLADREDKFNVVREHMLSAHQEDIKNLQSQSASEIQQLQEEFRMTFSALERKLTTEKEELAELHAQELTKLSCIHDEQLAIINQHHEAVVAELNKNCEEASGNVRELQQNLDDLRAEYQTLLAKVEHKDAKHKNEITKMAEMIRTKENSITDLSELIRRREKETADEWIQRETTIMAQFTAQNKKSLEDFERRVQEVLAQLQQSKEETERMKMERDAALDDVAVFQVQSEAQLAALNEQYDQERAMLIDKLAVQTREIEEINSAKINELQAQLSHTQLELQDLRKNTARQMERMEHDREEAILTAVREALEPVDSELESLRKDREAYLLLKKEYQELQARIEPFREQLEMFEAEKRALLNQAQNAESSMASLASKYTQLLGHQNSKQKIHHLAKLKEDIFQLRKELADKNLALEKEKKARQKADARVKELSGQKKYDPSEAFKVPENPAVTPATPAPSNPVPKSRPSMAAKPPALAANPESREPLRQQMQRKPLRANATGFFVSMDDVEKARAEMELEKQMRMEARRNASSANFEAFEVDFGNGAARRETFDVPPKLNVTRNMNEHANKENISHGLFPQDISGISISDDIVLKSKIKSRADNLTSTPLQRTEKS